MNLLILTGLFPPQTGGPATYVPRIASDLKNKSWQVEVITGGTDETDEAFEFPVHRVPSSLMKRLPRSVPLLSDRINWADRVYVNGLELDHAIVSILKKTSSVQKIVGDRSWERYRNRGLSELSIDQFQTNFPGLKSSFEKKLQQIITRRNDQFIVPSKYLKNIVHNWGINREQIHVIYNHSLPPETIPDDKLDWPGEGLKLLTVGRLVPWKRVPQLIKIVGNNPNDGLIVLGNGPERKVCQKIIEKNNLSERIDLKGTVPRKVVWQHLNESDALILNSTYEGFPHILLEALETGTPVIASNSGGSKELAQFFPDKIELYPKENPRMLKGHLKDSLSDAGFQPPERPEPLQWDTIVDQTDMVLRNL